MKSFQALRSPAIPLTSFHDLLVLLISSSIALRHVLFGLPLLLYPWGFQSNSFFQVGRVSEMLLRWTHVVAPTGKGQVLYLASALSLLRQQQLRSWSPCRCFSLEPLRGYQGEDIEIQLPGNLTVYDIDWLAVWCVQYRHNFGHVRIPKDLDVPPALGQTKITVSL